MKRWPVFVALLTLVGVVAWAAAPHGAAQDGGKGGGDEEAFVCRTTQYDLTKDGVLTKADMTAWTHLAQADGCLYTSLDSNEACKAYDFNDDRFVDDLDVAVAHDLFMACVFSPYDRPSGR